MTKEIAWKRQTIETPQPSDNNFLVNEIINVDNPEEATNDTEFNFVNNEKNGKKFADIWNYISYNNSKKRVCKKCSYVFSDKSGNSSIERHMVNLHNIKIKKKQSNTLQTMLNFQVINPWPENERNKRDNLLIRWVIGNLQPFNIVENKYFIEMIKQFDSRYKLPDRHKLKNLVIEFFNQKKNLINKTIDAIPGKASLTTDMWTSLNNDSFLGLTIHYIDSKWEFKHFLLDIISFKERHTSHNISVEILNIINEYNLLGKLIGLTSDNEAAMVAAGRTIEDELKANNNTLFKHYRCAAHILNLAAKQGIEIIDVEVSKVREVMSKIKNSVLLCDSLKRLCEFQNLEYLKPELDIKTRWNSTYYMIKKFQKLEPSLRMLAANERVINDLLPTNEGLTKIEDTVMLLEPLEHATKLLSASSYPTIADVKLVFSAIQEFLEEYIEDDDLLQYEMAGSINTKLDEYRSIIDKSTIIATILNPQAKLSNFQPGSESSSAISNLRIKFQEYLDEYSIIQELNPPQTNSQYNYRKYFQQLKNHKSNNQSPQPSTLE
ncbi:5423_t:CDS:2, partial [Entrophospora sp. SA101]